MKKIVIITATRAEYGMLRPLIEALGREPSFDVKVVVTGAHLLAEYGNTYKLIENDGIEIAEKISIPIDTSDAFGISNCMGVAIVEFARYFRDEKPDLVIVLGDRYEIPAFCIAAMNERVPIAHIAGGETTEGAVDEAYRHAVTKMSYLHFTAAESYRHRVIQLGESPERVFNVGSLTLENILQHDNVSREELEQFLGISLAGTYALMTFHPVTLDDEDPTRQAKEVIDAMIATPEIEYICTKANADVGGMAINELLEEAQQRYSNIHLYSSLGQARYFSLMSGAAFVLGNTSSGIGEAPAFKVPTVNIGNRQKGRLRADSIIDCNTQKDQIIAAINKAMSEEFRAAIVNMVNPYGDGHSSEKIVEILKKQLADDIDLKKKFYDIDFCVD